MVSVSADSVAVMPRTAAVTLPNITALATANSAPMRKLSAPGAATSSTPRKPATERAGARQTDFFLEPERGEQRGEQRRGEIDGDGAAERHQRKGDDDEALRHRLRAAAAEVIAQALRAEHGQSRARQDQHGADGERDRPRGRTAPRRTNSWPPAISRSPSSTANMTVALEHIENAARHAVGARGWQALVETVGGQRGVRPLAEGMPRLARRCASGQGQNGMAALRKAVQACYLRRRLARSRAAARLSRARAALALFAPPPAAAAAFAVRAADDVLQVVDAVVVDDFLARLDVAQRADEHAVPDVVSFGVRIAGMVEVARDVAARRAVDGPAAVELVEVAVAARLEDVRRPWS